MNDETHLTKEIKQINRLNEIWNIFEFNILCNDDVC